MQTTKTTDTKSNVESQTDTKSESKTTTKTETKSVETIRKNGSLPEEMTEEDLTYELDSFEAGKVNFWNDTLKDAWIGRMERRAKTLHLEALTQRLSTLKSHTHDGT